MRAARYAAQQILSKFWKDKPFPVDSAAIALEVGVCTKETILPEEICGALVKTDDIGPEIVLSKLCPRSKARFICAYELGCYIFISNTSEIKKDFCHVFFSKKSNLNKSEDLEIFANEFANSLLMPKHKIEEILEREKNPFFLSLYFGVTVEHINDRLESLGF